MIIEIAVGVIAVAFVVLSVFAITGIVTSRKTMKELAKFLHGTKRDLDELTGEGLKLVKNLNDVTADAKKKLHVLDPLFEPFMEAKQERGKHGSSLVSDIAECLGAALVLYTKIKGGIRDYVNQR